MNRRVVVTGIGIASPIGIGRVDFWNALVAGVSGVRSITSFDATGFPCAVAGQVPDYKLTDFVPKAYRKATKLMARDIELAVIAASMAFEDANLSSRGSTESTAWDSTRFGCNIGAGLISVDLDELTAAMTTANRDGRLELHAWGSAAMERLTPLWLLKYLPNMLACHVTIIHGLEGPSNTLACGEASGHLAIGEAFRTIQRGQADLMICGGAETKVNPMGMMRQTLLGRLARPSADAPENSVRPFSPDADGTVNSEGGGLLILEEIQHAVRRGARIYAEVAGFGAGQDVASINGEEPSTAGYEGTLKRALADSRLSPGALSLLIPSGSGVKEEDTSELIALKRIFGLHATQIPTTLTKPQLGSLAAGTSIEAAVAALSLSHGQVPPTLSVVAEDIGLNVSKETRTGTHAASMSTARSTGGQSAALVFKSFQ